MTVKGGNKRGNTQIAPITIPLTLLIVTILNNFKKALAPIQLQKYRLNAYEIIETGPENK